MARRCRSLRKRLKHLCCIFYSMRIAQEMNWRECSGAIAAKDAAKRNLRNCLYKIRIELGEDFILTKGNSYVYVNPELAVERDTDIFIMEDNEKKLLELNNFNFMDKVYLKNCVEFEKWVLSVQNAYERVITQKLLAAMKNNLTKCKYNLAEKYARQVLALDRHQEEACCALMRIYEKEGDFNKAIQIYRKFSDDLQRELDIEPDTQTQETYNDILKKKQQRLASGYSGTSNPKILSALNGLLEEFSGYEKKESYKTCFLCGDFGMGKEKILESFANHITKTEIYTIEFSEINRNIEYYGIYRILERLKKSIVMNWEICCSRMHLITVIFHLSSVSGWQQRK